MVNQCVKNNRKPFGSQDMTLFNIEIPVIVRGIIMR